MYVKLNSTLPGCEKHYDYIRKVENVEWLGVNLYQKWLNVDPRKLSLQAQRKCSRGVLMLQRTGLRSLREAHMNQYEIESPSKWPLDVLAVSSLYKIAQTILQNHEGRNNLMGEMGEILF